MKRLLAALFLSCLAGAAIAQERRQDRAGDFDFYVLSLSWSPTFCASKDGPRNAQQCGAMQDFRFVVHGLWPQKEKGYPDFCESREPDRVPQTLGKTFFDLMPSMGLIGHQWRKHGSCTGLSQAEYLAKTRDAYNQVKLPADLAGVSSSVKLSPDGIEEKFVAANPGMSRRGIAASCEGKRLEEVRICLTKDLQFRECAEVDQDGCRASSITLPPPR